MSDFDPRPPASALVPAVLASLFVFLTSLASTSGLAIAAAGASLVVYGGHSGGRRFVTTGGAALFLAVLFNGTAGADPALTLAGGAAAVIAYDAAEHAVSLGHDVGRNARVGQAMLVHVASTTSVVSMVAALSYAVYEYGPGSQPVTALVALLLGGVFLAYTLRD